MFCKIKNRDYLCTAIRKESQFFVLMNVANAKIAQLVEHNLAKVGVAGSSPVFRSPLKLTVEAVNFFCPGGGIGRHATLRG